MSNPIKRDQNSPVNSTSNLPDEAAYQEGYRTGRDSERFLQEESYVTRETNSAASGLTMGLALALIAALAGGTIYFLTQRQEPTKQTAPSTQIVPVPVPNNSQPQTPSSKKETTIIERTIDKTREVVPVPAQPSVAPSPEQPSKAPSRSAPNININVPPAQPQSTENKTSPAQPQTNGADGENSNTNQ